MNKEILEQMRRLAVSILDYIKIAQEQEVNLEVIISCKGILGALLKLDQDMRALRACYDYLLVANGRRLP